MKERWSGTPARIAQLCCLAGAVLLAGPVQAVGAGLTELDLVDSGRERPLSTQLWYPSPAGSVAVSMSYDLAFRGQAVRAAPYLPAPSPRALILLSHGDRGSAIDQSWLAEALAVAGYLVAAPAHWMNTWKKNAPEATLAVWERPQDLSFVLDHLLADPVWGPRIDATRIGVAGHSAGGYTALALLGARYAPRRMSDHCNRQPAEPACKLAKGANLGAVNFRLAAEDYSDPRVRAAWVMAPALGPGLVPESLAKISNPVALVYAKDDEILPPPSNAERIAAALPPGQLLVLEQGGHFVFMPECTWAGRLFTWFHRFDICGRRGGVETARPALHRRISTAARQFFDQQLPAR